MLHIIMSILIGLTAIGQTAYAEEPQEKSKFAAWLKTLDRYATAATPRQRLLASIGCSVGFFAAMLGCAGIDGYNLRLLQKIGPVGSYTFFVIPGIFLALCSELFLFTSAKGWYAKLNSISNACGMLSGAGCFVIGSEYVLKRESDKAMLMGILSVVFTMWGILDNLQDKPKPDSHEIDTEQADQAS
jgi:hypothetical protein